MKIFKRNEHGGAMPFVLVVGASLLFVAAYSMNVGINSRRAAASDLQHRAAAMCAENALATARHTATVNKADWDNVLQGLASAGGWHPVRESCYGTGGSFYAEVRMRDNNDAANPPLPDNPEVDNDGTIILDAIVYRRGYGYGVPLTQVSAVVSGTVKTLMSSHKQWLGDSSKTANF